MPRITSDNPRIVQSIRNLEKVKKYIDSLPRLAKGPASEAAAAYLVEKLRFYPPYKFYGRAEAYPEAHLLYPEKWLYMGKGGVLKYHKPIPGYFSLKQFRKVMSLKSKYEFGYPHRTGKLKRGWEVVNTGTKVKIVNETPGAPFVMGNNRQARQPRGVGWQRVNEIIEENRAGMIKAAKAELLKDKPKTKKKKVL